MKKKIILALSVLDKVFRVDKCKGVRSIRVYFDGFLSGATLDILSSIAGLHIVGINCDERYILVIY